MNSTVTCALCKKIVNKKETIVIGDDNPEVTYKHQIDCLSKIREEEKKIKLENEKKEREKYSHLNQEQQRTKREKDGTLK